jgi:hypothetical protein
MTWNDRYSLLSCNVKLEITLKSCIIKITQSYTVYKPLNLARFHLLFTTLTLTFPNKNKVNVNNVLSFNNALSVNVQPGCRNRICYL